ncbi:MAG TPA: toxin VasX, partial [Ideonella sp.]|nr:toxin VasX [Ideonella sp.]
MSSPETCIACEASGLPILFTYHTVLAKDNELAPPLATALKSHEASATALHLPALADARYALRSLRPGTYLHLFHEKPSEYLQRRAQLKQQSQKPAERDPDEAHWEVLRAIPGGALVPADGPAFVTCAPFSCRRDGGSHIYTAMTYRLRDAHRASGLWAAASPNFWDRSLRAANKKNPEVMVRLDIAQALGGGGPDMIHPEPAWLNQHVADCALANLKHAQREGSSPLAPLRGCGEALANRMAALAKGHPKTEGKGFVYVLADPVGT